MTLRMPNKHFWRRCRGRLITNKEWIRNFESSFASLIWLRLSILSYSFTPVFFYFDYFMQGNVWIEDILQKILLMISKNYLEKQEPSSRRHRQHFSTKASSNPEDRRSFIRNLSSQFEAMANKSIREFLAPTTDNIRTGPAVEIDCNFELKPRLINMVQANQFCGKAHEDASAHLCWYLVTPSGNDPQAHRYRWALHPGGYPEYHIYIFTIGRKRASD